MAASGELSSTLTYILTLRQKSSDKVSAGTSDASDKRTPGNIDARQ
jgi:hypothetical protein